MPQRTDDDLLNSLHTARMASGSYASREDAWSTASDVAGYSVLARSPHPLGTDASAEVGGGLSVRSNADFWRAASSCADGTRVRLEDFILTEWCPLSPGRFHTPYAASCREQARKDFYRYGEYAPPGKVQMMAGGIGSLRLAARVMLGQPMQIWGASSTGVSHQGLPVLVPSNVTEQVAEVLGLSGGAQCSFGGRIHSFPRTAELPLQYDRGVRRRYVLVDEVHSCDRFDRDKIRLSGAVLLNADFPGCVFASFRPVDDDIQEAAHWIEEYIKRYAPDASILSDFDETTEWFNRAHVELPIRDAMAGQIRPGGNWNTTVINVVNSTIDAMAVGEGATAHSGSRSW